MSFLQIKETQLPTPMETDINNRPPHPGQVDRTEQPTHIDRYQYLMLDSVALEAIDRAWLDARKRSFSNPFILEKFNNKGKKYSGNPTKSYLIRIRHGQYS